MQLALPLDTSLYLDPNDNMFGFLEAVEGVDFSKYVKSIRSNNTHSHDKGMLLKTLLFAFSEGHRTLSEIEQLCKTDIRYIYLSNEERPSKMAFQRLTADLTASIDQVFFDISSHIAKDLMLCDMDVQYVDGTKIEANAHKNSFVYKKRILNAQDRLFFNISEEILQLNEQFGYSYPIEGFYDSQSIGYICQYLMEVMIQQNIELHYGKGQRKNDIQRYYDQFMVYYEKTMEYEYWLDILGERNSCSKVDFDATFMATKWDYYNQSGITRPCYNCQIGVSDSIIVNADVFQNPGDTVTWEQFMERHASYYGEYPKKPVADAGYGGYDNYLFNISHGIDLVQKYNMYGKENDKKFQKKKFNSYNWKKNEDGFKVCPNGRVFDQYERDSITYSRKNNPMISQLYSEKNHCEGCPFKEQCTKSEYKTIGKNVVQEELQASVNKNLGTEEGRRLKRQRSIQVEGAFGVIKQDFKFTRFTRRGMKNVKMEFLLVCLGYNLRKYYIYRNQNKQNNKILN